MLLPNVPNEFEDRPNGIKFVVMAYRKLSDQEVLQAVRHYGRTQAKPRRGSVVKIISTIGSRG